MKHIKDFKDIKENIDYSGYHLMLSGIRKKIPSFNIIYGPNKADIYINNVLTFSTRGSETTSVIHAYVSGIFKGLQY